MASDYHVFPNVQSQGSARGTSQQGKSSPTQQLPLGRPFSAANHSRLPSDSSKSNMGDPPRSQSTMHYYPEQFYIDKNFDIDKALEYWGLWDSEIKLEGHPDENQKLSQSPSSLCPNRKAPNPGLKRANDLTDFIFNPDCPECCSAVWPTSQLSIKSPFSFHKSQNSWSTVSTEDSSDLTPDSSYSSSSCALAPRQRPTMHDQTAPERRLSLDVQQPQPQSMPEYPPKMSHRLSRPAPSFPEDGYFVILPPSPPDDCTLCPDCSAAPPSTAAPSTRGRQSENPSRPSSHRVPTQSSVSSVHKPLASADSLPRLSTARTNSTSQGTVTRFSPSRPAPKPNAQRSASRSVSRPASSRKNTQITTSDPTPPTSSELSPDCSQERSVWESDSDSEDGSKFRMSSLRKVKSKITLRRVTRSTSRLSMGMDDAVPPLPSNIGLSFSKKNASTGSIQPVGEELRKREPSMRSSSPLLVSQPATSKKVDAGKSQTPTPDINSRQKIVKKAPEQSKIDAHEATKQVAARFYSCSQTQTDINLIPHQKGIKQAWGAIRSRMKVLACSKVRNATGHIDFSEKSEKD